MVDDFLFICGVQATRIQRLHQGVTTLPAQIHALEQEAIGRFCMLFVADAAREIKSQEQKTQTTKSPH